MNEQDDINPIRNSRKTENSPEVSYEPELDTAEIQEKISNGVKIENEEESSDLSVQVESKFKKLKEKLKKCQKEKEEYLAGWQRAKADFINFKKDQEKQQMEFAKFSNTLLVSEILLVLDSFDLALQNNKDNVLLLIKSQLNDILKKYGLEEIKTKNEKFNPEFHEAVEEVESGKESSDIIEEVQKGYMLHGKVLRATKVKISK